MKMVRTTLRIEEGLSQSLSEYAYKHKVSKQKILNDALRQHFVLEGKKKRKKLVFCSKGLGVNLDNLTRADFYDD